MSLTVSKKKLVAISLLGPTLDAGESPRRWDRWRPNISLVQFPDLLIDRLELLHQNKFNSLANLIKSDAVSAAPETEIRLHEIEIEDAWSLEEVYGALYEFARNYHFRPDQEEYLIHITTGTHIAQICLYLLTEAHYFPGKLLQLSPPRGSRVNSPGSYAIIDLDLSQYDRIASRFDREKKEGISFLKDGIETKNSRFNALMDQIEKVAIKTKDPILLTGPTGAGKSRLAERIFDLKHSRHQVKGHFVSVNCATIRGDGAMSTLFGHSKGSFTGATSDRPGLLKAAHDGILFLDEIGELGLDEQAMLLRALEDKTFLPLGSDKPTHSNFQLFAGTNRDLKECVSRGEFREDLYSRINLWTFQLPGLKERPEDIEPNTEYELERYSKKNSIQTHFNKEAREKFLKFAISAEAQWHGNFRELNSAITRMSTLCQGGRIGVETVEEEIERLRNSWTPSPKGSRILEDLLGKDKVSRIDLFDRVQLQEVVQICKSSRSLSEAGRTLFNASLGKKQSRNDADRLRKYLARFDLTWDDLLASKGPI